MQNQGNNNNNKLREIELRIWEMQNQLQTLQNQRDLLLEEQRHVELNGTLMHVSPTRWEQILRYSKRYKFETGRPGLQSGVYWIHEFNFGDLLVDSKNDNEEGILVVGESQFYVHVLQYGDDDDGLAIRRKRKSTEQMVLQHAKRFWCSR